jgi:hypothetical protein
MQRVHLLAVIATVSVAAASCAYGKDAGSYGGDAGGGTPTPQSGGSGGSGGGSGSSGGSAGGLLADGGSSAQTLALPTSLAAPNPCTSNVPGPRKLWRLTAAEFTASIRSIFNDTANAAPIATIFSDPSTLGFSIDANTLLVQGLNASQLEDNAEAIAAWAATSNSLAPFASCAQQSTGAPTASCATSFIQAFGRAAFRTTLASNDPRIATYSKLFMAGSSNSDGAQMVVSAMLQSPYFLYRSELGVQTNGTFALTPYEVTTELAYTLTGTTPDTTLLNAADAVNAGTLTMTAMINQQVTRLLGSGSTAGSVAVMGFMDGWLGLSRLYTTAHDATVYQLTASLQQDMWNESQGLILEAFSGGGTFGSVLTADHSFLNQELATFYGIPTTGLGTSFTPVKYAGATTRDPGLLATGTILNGYARPDTDSPTQRGHMVRSRMLCQAIPPPPPGLNTTFMPSTMVETTREHFINEHEQGVCASCHQLMDWIGFAFESYDGWGRYRTTENGLPIDNTAIVYEDPEGNDDHLTGLSGTQSLPSFLAQSSDVTQCMERYWTYYTYGTSTWAQDACTYDAIGTEAQTNGQTLQSILLAIIHAPNFTSRVQDQ